MRDDDEGVAPPEDKLIPEWSLGGDDQIVVVGLAVLGIFLGILGWNALTGDDGDAIDAATGGAATIVEDAVAPAADASGDALPITGADDETGSATVDETDQAATAPPDDDADGSGSDDETDATAPPTTADTSAPTTAAPDLSPDVAAAVAGITAVTGTADGTVALLTGVVGTDAERDEIGAAAAAVDGITAVDNQLVVLQPGVTDAIRTVAGADAVTLAMNGTEAVVTGVVPTDDVRAAVVEAAGSVEGVTSVDDQLTLLEPAALQALTDAGVAGPAVSIDGTSADGATVTVTGELAEEAARQPTLDAVAAVPGVAGVVDQLTVAGGDVAAALNALLELEPIRFETNSADIRPESTVILDRAAEILVGNEVPLEVQGYTDVRGADDINLELSQARAERVLAALGARGVDVSGFTAVGYGETTEFAEGDSPEALAANRRVRFQPI